MRWIVAPGLLLGICCAGALAGDGVAVDRQGDPLPPRAVARLGSIRFRGQLAQGPDAKSLLTIRGNRAAVVDIQTGAAIRYLPGPDPRELEVQTFLVSADFRRVVYCGPKQAEIWDIESGDRLRTIGHDIENYGGDVRPVILTGRVLVLQNNGWCPTAGCWDVQSGQLAWKDPPTEARGGAGPGPARSVIGFHSGALVVLQRDGEKTKLKLVVPETGQVNDEKTLNIDILVNSAGLAPNGNEFAALDRKGKVHLVTIETGRVVRSWNGRLRQFGPDDWAEAYTTPACFSGDGKFIAVADPSDLRVFEAATGKEQSRTSRSGSFAMGGRVVWGADHTTVWMSDTYAPAWQAFDVVAGKAKKLPQYDGHQDPIQCLTVSPDGTRIITANPESTRIWDAKSATLTRRLDESSFSFFTRLRVNEIMFSSDGDTIAGADDGTVALWDAGTGKRRITRTLPQWSFGGSVALTSDCAVAAYTSGLKNGMQQTGPTIIRLFDMKKGKEIRQFSCPSGWRAAVNFSPDGQRLLVAGNDYSTGETFANIYDTQAGRIVHGLGDDVQTAKFLPFGCNIVFVKENEIIVRELSTGGTRRAVKMESHHPALIDLLAVSPEGRWLATASTRGGSRKILLWDLRSGEAMDPLVGHDLEISALAFAPGGRLISASGDTTALIWDVHASDVAKPLTQGELPDLWAKLGQDAGAADPAIHRFLDDGAVTLAYFKTQMAPTKPIDSQAAAKWLEQMDSPRYRDRQLATTAIEQMDTQAEPHLRKLAESAESAEARARTTRLLARLSGSVTDTNRLRELRAVEVLSRLNLPVAREFLRTLAAGDPAARLTRAAQTALGDVDNKIPPTPAR